MAKRRRRQKHPAFLYSTTAECPWCHAAAVDLATGTCPKCGTAVAGYKEKRFVMQRRDFWQRQRNRGQRSHEDPEASQGTDIQERKAA
ncbi:hypothetical protein [Nitrospira japonica]|uniref:hypothetical protein n=1 Tax=Nitrospira japonica TaxID=1325564 RepID=UPI0009B946DE|nr:hypothetical protein [Nitrospira japonica]